MKKEESLALFEKGVRCWNAWADQMLAEKKELEKSGTWEESDQLPRAGPVRSWRMRAEANFRRHVFGKELSFCGFRFPGGATFEGATFPRSADFSGAEFCGKAEFAEATFGDVAGFTGTKFGGLAQFFKATFSGRANFAGATFSKDARFDQAKFEDEFHFNQCRCGSFLSLEWASIAGRASFWKTEVFGRADCRDVTFSRYLVVRDSTFWDDVAFDRCHFREPAYVLDSSFKGKAEFTAVSGKGLTLTNVEFGQVPNFSAAHFNEAPQFDRVSLEPERFGSNGDTDAKAELPEKWRALRRLASQGHDHERELQFFKGEIMARRGTLDKWTGPRFWAGWIYEVLSDFGHSLIRPLLWLVISVWMFTGIYLSQSDAEWKQSWEVAATCANGSPEAIIAAWSLSVHHAVPFSGIGSSGKAEQIYACLYGLRASALPDGRIEPEFVAVIPDGVAFAGAAQFFISAVLIFLFVLAIRNQFRIR